MSEPVFRSDIRVLFDDASAKGDRGIAHRAWACEPSMPGPDRRDDPDGWRRVIRAMVKGRHGTPFEGGYLSVYVEAPVVVWWEWTRHRFMSLGCPDLGFNLESGRYKVLDGQFYVPPEGRPCREPDGFRPMRPALADDADALRQARSGLESAARSAWNVYSILTRDGVSREVARLALGFNLYYAGYVSANPRTWMQFFSLRRNDPAAAVATYPQWEIEQADVQCERLFGEMWPITYDEFNRNGRVAPGA